MGKPNVTTLEAARCLRLLEEAAEPIVAADLAVQLRLAGSRETQRRHVRAIVKLLREKGNYVVATLQGGYCLTSDIKQWKEYLGGRQIDAKKILGRTGKQKKMISDRTGQGLLFVPPRRCGIG